MFGSAGLPENLMDAIGVGQGIRGIRAHSATSKLHAANPCKTYPDRDSARLDLAKYIDGFYNPVRLYSYLGAISPSDFETAHCRRNW